MQKLLATVEKLERVIAATAFGLLAALVVLDIFSREVLHQSFPIGPKLAIDFMIWGGFLGASLCAAKGTHLKIDAGEKLWPQSLRPFAGRMETLVTGAFCVFMAWLSIRYVHTSQELGEVGVVTRIPVWISQLVIPYTFVSMSVRYAAYFVFPALKPLPPIGEGR